MSELSELECFTLKRNIDAKKVFFPCKMEKRKSNIKVQSYFFVVKTKVFFISFIVSIQKGHSRPTFSQLPLKCRESVGGSSTQPLRSDT